MSSYTEEMAQAAKEMQTSSLVTLEEAIRQAKRYLNTHKPSTRIIEQRIQRIQAADSEFRRHHITYCEKAGIGVDSTEAKNYVQPKLDDAIDAMDECTAFIEDREQSQREQDAEAQAASIREGDKQKDDVQYQRCLIEMSIDERVAKEFCRKVQELVQENEITADNAVLMQLHLNGLDEVHQNLIQLWKEIMSMPRDVNENNTRADEIFTLKTTLQNATSDAVMYIEKCKTTTRADDSDDDKEKKLQHWCANVTK